jgi:uncharacterized protein DUF4386
MSTKPQMTPGIIEPSQQSAAKAAGFLYLFLVLVALLSEFYVRLRLVVPADPAQTARNLGLSSRLFRIGIFGDLVTVAGDIALICALYVILKPVNRTLALLAVFWRLAACSVLAATILNDFAALRLLSGAGYLNAFSSEQLQALARYYFDLEILGYRIGAAFFALGTLAFAYLWYKSRYIPRPLAVWGILSSLLPLIVVPSVMLFPRVEEVFGNIRRARTGIPMIIFEIVLGIWLLVKGVRAPQTPIPRVNR